ncbi:MAG: type ISP restriction/modification enzyme [Salinibacter sp.]
MSTKDSIRSYLDEIGKVAQRGDAREESFYGVLKSLLETHAASTDRDDAAVTVLPKATEGGNPDVRVWNGQNEVTGYIEAKHPTVEDLDRIERTEQLKRYRDTFPNLILTNFFEFRLYRHGERVATAQIARPYVLHELGQTPPVENAQQFNELLEQFFAFSMPRSFTAESLAVELAKRTRFLHDIVLSELEREDVTGGDLLGFYEAFQTYLISQLDFGEFADLYAQTITYGLFAARVRTDGPFHRRMAYERIPHTIGVLRDLFQFISLGDPPQELEVIVDDIASVLAAADAGGILERYFREGKGSDPIVHFYETFLAEYDPAERERRGVYYTPQAVVSYIVRSLHKLLKTEFAKSDGLASDGVTLLDPAAGTMTFVARACQEAAAEFEEKYGQGGRESFIRDHILENFYAFELMMAPYAVGHLKMSFFLEELGHELTDDERFQFYLTNTLEMEELEQTSLPGVASLAEESRMAGEVKKERPILVILGNPPYSGHSSNRSEWIRGLIDDYKQVDGEPLGERNPKWLQDDYVKFLRWAQWKIDQTGEGVVGVIANHSYLDNPTFRGMRQSLMTTFDEIRVLDLHGNSLKRETAPDGSADENVFDIRQGVAIAFFIKRRDGDSNQPATVYHADLWGKRDDKYLRLLETDVETTEWQEIEPKPEFYLFALRDEKVEEIYLRCISIGDVFSISSIGIVTSRDKFVFSFKKDSLEKRMETFLNPRLDDATVREAHELKDNRDWKMSEKRKLLQNDPRWQEKIMKCLYRPFDVRWLFYHYHAVDFGREDIMKHLVGKENIALLTKRQGRRSPYSYIFVTDKICESCVFESAYANNTVHPLYLYPDTSRQDLFSQDEPTGKREPNLNPNVVEALTAAYDREPTPEEIFHYVYAVLYAPSYREKYADFLKIDFPKVPFTSDVELFEELAKLGERLVKLHLLTSDELDLPIARFHGEGDGIVARTKGQGFGYDPDTERVHINESQYFAPISQDLWEYQIGGYQVLEKWLKDRKERTLSTDEIRTYCRVATALQLTVEIQDEIDALYPWVEAGLVEIDVES